MLSYCIIAHLKMLKFVYLMRHLVGEYSIVDGRMVKVKLSLCLTN
jgi:hypothetical protein